ncbi:MAG TPA: M48 family metalloprotease [Segeticoccus sp.]|uniref:M48 family metalloprotease n=1 Tax=Segeticoccus sp. TaxID=2706531 RepID=UPI002D800FAF|nr:M48 family metalloprotease [Segeticoccus sp.]HET8600312.1 M48 family metalloprotease [Segeticoccus sp.]
MNRSLPATVAVRPSLRALGVATALSAAGFAVVVYLLTPWHPLGAGAPPVRPDVHTSFTPGQIARAADFRGRLGPWPYVGLVLHVLVPWVALWLAGRRAGRDGAATRWRWPTVVATVVVIALVQWVVTAPTAIHEQQVLRDFGISRQGWAGWARDQAVSWVMSTGVAVVGVLVLFWLVRRVPRRWPFAAAVAAAVLTVLGSAAYPVLVEPAFNTFRPLPRGPLTTAIQELAHRDGLGPINVVVADASRRTTGENAHVSGLGATRRVVIDDTVLHRAGQRQGEVLAIVAHELGHVEDHDVARGTAIGAAGALTGVLALGLLLSTRRGRRWFVPTSRRPAAVARTCALVLAIAATAPYVVAPLSMAVSRKIEATADVRALQATHDVPAFVQMQRDLAVTNLSDLTPAWWQTWWFASHPSPPWRIAQAHSWQQLQR